MDKFIAYIDVLGFKVLLKNLGGAKLVHLYQDLLNSALPRASNLSSTWAASHFPGYIPGSIHSLVFSDSIILWTDNNAWESFAEMATLLKVLFGESLQNHNLAMRGAIAFGELEYVHLPPPSGVLNFHPSDLLVGQALVEAYQAEGSQQWHGCMILDSAWNRLTHAPIPFMQYLNNTLAVPYRVPGYTSRTQSKVIDWTPDSTNTGNFTAPWIKKILVDIFTHYDKNALSNCKVKKKLVHTKKFWVEMARKKGVLS
jgi:hypothetical protein